MATLWSRLMTVACILCLIVAGFVTFGPDGAIHEWIGPNPSDLAKFGKWAVCILVFWVGLMQILALGFPRPSGRPSPHLRSSPQPFPVQASKATVAAGLSVLGLLIIETWRLWLSGVPGAGDSLAIWTISGLAIVAVVRLRNRAGARPSRRFILAGEAPAPGPSA